MKNVITIAKRDLSSSFSSMIAYVVIGIFLMITGYFFFSFTSIYGKISFHMGSDPSLAKGINQMDAILRPLFMNISVVMLLVLPIITMRSVAEEKKQGTIELLYTYPFTDLDIVLGKFLALMSVFIVMIAPTLVYVGMLALCQAHLPTVPILVSYLGMLLLGMSFISLGLFASSLTENQTVAAVLSFGILLLFWIIGWAYEIINVPWLGVFLKEISLITHYENFVSGVLSTNDLVFYVLVTVFFLYVTFKSIEKRSWR